MARGREQNRSRCDILRSACAAAKAIASTRRRKEKKKLTGNRKEMKQRNTPTEQPRPQQRKEATREREPEEENTCPKCGHIVLQDNKFCGECGTKAMRQPARHNLGPELEELRKTQGTQEKEKTTRNDTERMEPRPREGPNRERELELRKKALGSLGIKREKKVKRETTERGHTDYNQETYRIEQQRTEQEATWFLDLTATMEHTWDDHSRRVGPHRTTLYDEP
jgi:hypothetical protein